MDPMGYDMFYYFMGQHYVQDCSGSGPHKMGRIQEDSTSPRCFRFRDRSFLADSLASKWMCTSNYLGKL